MGDLPMVYTPFLVLDTGQGTQPEVALERPVLALRLVCADNLVECRCPVPCQVDCLALPSRRSAHTDVMQTIGNLNLSGLKSLDLSMCCAHLDHLSLDVGLINLSEIRQAIINVVYQHNDFDDGANIDYIINSAVSQILNCIV